MAVDFFFLFEKYKENCIKGQVTQQGVRLCGSYLSYSLCPPTTQETLTYVLYGQEGTHYLYLLGWMFMMFQDTVNNLKL